MDAKEVVHMTYMTYEQTIMLFMFVLALIELVVFLVDRNGKKK